jgi:hypothetical protein
MPVMRTVLPLLAGIAILEIFDLMLKTCCTDERQKTGTEESASKNGMCGKTGQSTGSLYSPDKRLDELKN